MFVRLSINPSELLFFYRWGIDWKSNCKWWIDWKSDLMDFFCMWLLKTSGPFSLLCFNDARIQRSLDFFGLKEPQPFLSRWCEWGIRWSLRESLVHYVVLKNNHWRNIDHGFFKVPSKSRGSMSLYFVLVALEGFWGSILNPPKGLIKLFTHICACVCWYALYIYICTHMYHFSS